MDSIQTIPLAVIDVPEDRLRPVDPDRAELIAQSMSVQGQRTAIEVVAAKRGGRYRLVFGGHRLVAARGLGWETIKAIVMPADTPPERLRLDEIDENLARAELSPLDRATHLAERFEIYKRLYPDTVQGKAGAAARWGNASDKLSFASDTAARIGVSERDIQRSIARHTKIAADVRAQIALTWIAGKGVELDALAKLEPPLQRRVVTALLNGDAKSVRAAVAAVSGQRTPQMSPEDVELDRLRAAWRRAGARARMRFVDELRAQGALGAERRPS